MKKEEKMLKRSSLKYVERAEVNGADHGNGLAARDFARS